MNQLISLLSKEYKVEMRNRHNLASIFLFAIIIVYVLYKAFSKMVGMEWNVMLWITLLFASINAIAKSFTQETSHTRQYYYHLVSPEIFIIAKLIYNTLLLSLIFGLTVLGFTIFLGSPVIDMPLFLIGASLGILGFSIIMTFVSSISSESEGGSALLMAVLSIPLTIPIILLLINITAVAIGRIDGENVTQNLWYLGGIDLLIGGISLFLFYEVWKN